MKQPPVIVSACLVGTKTRYDGDDALSHEVVALLDANDYVALCPEELAGLGTPRPRAWITRGCGTDVLAHRSEVVNERGELVTAAFVRGAREAARTAEKTGARLAYLKEKSPSCGVSHISRGAGGKTAPGPGVFAALLEDMGMDIKGF